MGGKLATETSCARFRDSDWAFLDVEIYDAFLREEVVKVGLLSVGTLEHVAEHRHQVLLCLHVMSHVTVICL